MNFTRGRSRLIEALDDSEREQDTLRAKWVKAERLVSEFRELGTLADLQAVVRSHGELVEREAELVESEETAWQTVAKLRTELETVDRLRRERDELRGKVAGLEGESQRRKGVMFPDHKPTDGVVLIWRRGPWQMCWIKHRADSLRDGEYWQVFDDSPPDERKGEG